MRLFIQIALILLCLGAIYALITKPDLLVNPEKPNAAADGFSRFYQNFRNSLQKDSNQSEFVLKRRDSSEELVLLLRRREQQVTPMNDSWRGNVSRRRFKQGDTIKESLERYAKEEGMLLFWTLPRDYVVKQLFEINANMVNTLQEIAFTIGPDFPKPVHGYVCPKSRALVITDLDDPYLKQHCFATGSSAQLRR